MIKQNRHRKGVLISTQRNFLSSHSKLKTNLTNNYPLLISFLLMAFAVCCLLTPADASAASVGKVTGMEGKVDILREGKLPAIDVKIGDSVFVKDVVRTKSSSKAEITFNDSTILKVAQRSRIDISEYISEGGSNKTVIDMQRGKVNADVSKTTTAQIAKSPGANKFEIRTPSAIAGVRGTNYFVFYTGNSVTILVTEGTVVTYNPKFPNVKIEVSAGQMTTIAENKPPTTPRTATEADIKGHLKDVTPEKGSKKSQVFSFSSSESQLGMIGLDSVGTPQTDPQTGTQGTTGTTVVAVDVPVSELYPELLGDITPPQLITIPYSAHPESGASPGLGDLTTISFNLSSNEIVTYTYSMDAGSWVTTGPSLTIPGVMEGPHTLEVQATDEAGNLSSNALAFDLSRYSLSGNFWGCIGNVTGTATGEVAGVSNQNWGGWDITMSGTGNPTPNPAWTLYAGGISSDATYADGRNNGYWIEIAPGATDFTSQTLSGISTLKYLSYDRMGTGTGILTGSYVLDPLGYFSNYSLTDTGTGTYTETPLTHVSEVFGSLYDIYGWYFGNMSGLMGGASSLWAGPADVRMMGEYLPSGFSWQKTFLADVYSNNKNSTYTTYDNGAYYGIVAGMEVYDVAAAKYNMDAKLYALYVDPAGNAGYLKGSLAGTGSPDIGRFVMDGIINKTEKVAGIGLTADALYSNVLTTFSGGGNFSGDGGNITGSDNWSFSSVTIANYSTGEVQNWGIYHNLFSGSYGADPVPGWTATMGGRSDPIGGYNCGGWLCNDGGYWLMDVTTGTWTGNRIDGMTAGRFLTPYKMGTMTGDLIGVYDGAGNWSAINAGVYEGTPLVWSGEIAYDYNYNGLYYNCDGLCGVGDSYGGLVGGKQSPWSGTTSLTLMGPYYDSWGYTSYLWNAPIYSFNQNDWSNTTYDGGAFWGLTGGVWKDDGTIDAKVYSLYIDPWGNAGILKGNLAGRFYPELNDGWGSSMFVADGTWTPTVLATGLDPLSLGSLTYSYDINFYSYLSSTPGGFSGGGTISAWNAVGLKYSMPGQDWGIWQILTTGAYSGPTSDIWDFQLEYIDFAGNFIIGTQTIGTQWSNGTLKGDTYGYYADITTTPTTGILIGETVGMFDPSIWHLAQIGAWLETNKFLAMTETADGQAKLAQLNIPAVEVGRANLTGSGNNMTVNMQDVIFFAHNNGQAPGVWATGNVNGSYTAAPVTGTAVGLTGNGLNVNFTPQTWNTIDNKWIATVNGGGTYTGTGTMNNTAVQMNGAGAGTINTAGSTFSGTAAGTAK